MTPAVVYAPGEKTHRDENFPVASYIISKKYRSAILAFYHFARAADDIADHPDMSETQKITQLDCFEDTLLGRSDAISEVVQLREALVARNLKPGHALDLLVAFRQDARKSRYKDWDDLMQYCAYSAAPVGRFVLDVHGESAAVWPASDALCSALQIINHLQDCKADYQRLDRVYIPHDALSRYGLDETALGATQASAQWRACLRELVEKTQSLMAQAHFSSQLKDWRLAIEVASIEHVADKLLALLLSRDPLSERVHLRKFQLMAVMVRAVLVTCMRKCLPAKQENSSG